jgi:hypothetical protein
MVNASRSPDMPIAGSSSAFLCGHYGQRFSNFGDLWQFLAFLAMFQITRSRAITRSTLCFFVSLWLKFFPVS